jgi:polyphosphate kinase
LRPGLPGVSDNIRVISIVGRFLEHTRIYYFANQGQPVMYAGSADLMPRNIDRRVEILFPIEDEDVARGDSGKYSQVYLRDTEKSYILQADGSYIPRSSLVDENTRSSTARNGCSTNGAQPAKATRITDGQVK